MKFLHNRTDLRVALGYALFGGVWILLSDQALAALLTDTSTLTTMQTYKGWMFVLFSSILIFSLLRHELSLHKITEGKFDESEERYRSLFEHSMDAILLTAPDGSILTANPAACRMFGRTELEIRQIGRSSIVDNSDPRLRSALEERARTGEFHGELTCLRSNGTKFEGDISTNLFKCTDGTERTSMIIRDITERKRYEEQQRLQSAALKFAANGIVITDRQGIIEWVNPAFTHLTGFSFEESLGRNPRDLVSSGLHDKTFYRQMWNTILGGQVWRNEIINRRKDGTYYTEEQAIAPVVNAKGDITHFVGIKQDITERKRTEQELYEKNNELLLAYDAVIEGWSRAMDLRDRETENHTARVTELSMKLANWMGVRQEELIHIKRGALLHDIGKLGVPDHILFKPGKLTDEEWISMRKHPFFAYEMLATIDFLKPALDIPYCHHEKWDGTGYPRGLKGEGIPLAARIFAVTDVWDALTSDRPYRPAWSKEQALDFIEKESGKHFDSRIVEAFLSMIGPINL